MHLRPMLQLQQCWSFTPLLCVRSKFVSWSCRDAAHPVVPQWELWGSTLNRMVSKGHTGGVAIWEKIQRWWDIWVSGEGFSRSWEWQVQGLEAGFNPRPQLYNGCAHSVLPKAWWYLWCFMPIIQMRKLSLHCAGITSPKVKLIENRRVRIDVCLVWLYTLATILCSASELGCNLWQLRVDLCMTDNQFNYWILSLRPQTFWETVL